MSLQVDIQLGLGAFNLNVGFGSGAGVTALFGRSGAGKSTVANAIAGLLSPQSGQITLGDRTLFDSNRHINLPPHQRRLGYVFQDARLFPHMSVAANLDFGTRFSSSTSSANERDRIIDMLGLSSLLNRRPGALSGGEKQRVAIGRALLSMPELLLMDEPLAALDADRKEEILPYLERLRDEHGLPILYVSHSLTEIGRLADTLVVMQQGAVVRAGALRHLMADPELVPLIGVRDAGAIIETRVESHDPDGLTRLVFEGGSLDLPGICVNVGVKIRVRVMAQDIILARARPEQISAQNILEVTVTSLKSGSGPGVAVGLLAGETPLLARITSRSANDLCLVPGARCFAILKATAVPRGAISAVPGRDR